MVDRAAQRGLEATMGFEAEWILDAGEGEEHVPATTGPAYGMDRLVEVSDYCRQVITALEEEAVEVEQLHPEYAPAQFELSMGPTDPVGAADRNLLVRHTIRAVTARAGMRCSFAPAVVPDGVGSGAHLHTSLWRDTTNLFAGGPGPHGITAEGESFMAGVLDGLPALLAIGAPSVASYMRLVPQRWSAPYHCWGLENREAGIRLVAGSEAGNFEVKCIDGAANPYLLVGTVLALGLDGVERELRLPPEATVDPASLTDDELANAGIARLPRTLDEALAEFRRSEVLAGAMGQRLFEAIVAVREAEIERFRGSSDEEIVVTTRFRY
jgi:glutamine synthetase